MTTPVNATATKGRLQVSGLHKQFNVPGGDTVEALVDCSFEMEPGRLNVVMGTSGCGKSTLAYLLAGYITADSGSLHMDGKAIDGPGSDRIMVFQETALWPWMRVTDNVTFGPLARGSMKRERARSQAGDLLAKFGLGRFRRQVSGPALRGHETPG